MRFLVAFAIAIVLIIITVSLIVSDILHWYGDLLLIVVLLFILGAMIKGLLSF